MPQPFVIKNHVVFPIKTTRPSLPGYLPGGWGYRKLLRIEAFSVPEDIHNVTALIDITDPDLRTVANGGKVESATGEDIVFALAGDRPQRIGHDRRLYDASTGRVVAYVLVPLVTFAADTGVHIYFGKVVGEDQNDQAGAWSAWESAFTGDIDNTLLLDATGYHRHGKLLGAVTVGSGPTAGCKSLSFGADLRLPDVPARRRSVISFWFKHGPLAGSGYETVYNHTRVGVAGIAIAFRRTGSGGDQVRITAFDDAASVTAQFNGVIDDSVWHLLHVVWDDGDGLSVYVDGAIIGTNATLNTRCEPGTTGSIAGAYSGVIALLRTGWRPFSTSDVSVDFTGVGGGLFTLFSAAEVVPVITMIAQTENPVPFSFTDDIDGLPLTIDYNLYILADTAPVAHLDAYPALDCVDDANLDRTCWTTAFPAFDVHSKWYATNVNLDKYQNPLNYQQQLSINTKLAVRTWHCDAPTLAYPTCVDTVEQFIQYLGSSDGNTGFFNPVTYTAPDANFTTDDYRAVVGADGFLSTIPTTAP